MRRGTLITLLVGSAFLSLSFSLQASSLVIGEPPLTATGNCDPFGCPGFFGLGTYQQVYTASAFPGAITISGLTFYSDQVQNGATPAGGTFDLSFSYTNKALGDLDTTNPNNNITSGSQEFFDGTLPFLAQNTLDFQGTPFAYNPADGNLLLTVTIIDPTDHIPTLFLDQSSMTNQTTNAYFGNSNGGNTGGLVTGFTEVSSVVTTPEPGSILLVLGGVGLLLRRRKPHKLF